jgi:hypothetical protein
MPSSRIEKSVNATNGALVGSSIAISTDKNWTNLLCGFKVYRRRDFLAKAIADWAGGLRRQGKISPHVIAIVPFGTSSSAELKDE